MDSVLDLLAGWSRRQPDRLLFGFHDRHGGCVDRHTYASMLGAVDDVAARLQEAGLAAGSRVLLAHPPGLGAVVSLLACVRAGMIAVPVAVPHGSDDAAMRRLRSIAGNCAAAALVSEGADLARLRGWCAGWDNRPVAIDAGPPFAGDRSVRHAPAQATLLLQYTSGSTGRPRGVVVSHANVIANARATLDTGPAGPPVGACWLPQHHDMGLIGYYLFPIVVGGSCHGMAPADFLRAPAAWLRLISAVRATHASAPEFGFRYCLEPKRIGAAELDGVDLASLRVLMSGGEPVRPDTMRRFRRRYARYGLDPDACLAAYGLAEATLNVAQGGRASLRLSRDALSRGHAVPAAGTEPAVDVASCGRPLRGTAVSVEDAGCVLPDMFVGEIRVRGPGVTSGYWNDPGGHDGGLRTGDMGFLCDGELFVCGRRKDVLVVAGANVHPDDLEAAVDGAGAAPRARGACAFQDSDGRVVVLAEAPRNGVPPDPALLAQAVCRSCGVTPDVVAVVAPHSIAVTTSGKLARNETRERWERGAIPALARWPGCITQAGDGAVAPARGWREAVLAAFARCGVADAARADRPLGDLGLDSLGLARLQLALEDALRDCGAGEVGAACDAPLLQQLTPAGLLAVLAPLDAGTAQGSQRALAALNGIKAAAEDAVGIRMLADARRAPASLARRPARAPGAGGDVFLTGATGFFGPFVLHELLSQTEADITVLVRAASPADARQRLEAALRRARLWSPVVWWRVKVVCGDLALPRLGLSDRDWLALAARTAAVYHNGALVNYVLNYDAMRATNVEGTRTMLALAELGGAVFHHVSSTFVFGWSARGVLRESDDNAAMQALDFGYAQTKWVAERLALAARGHGLDVRVYRPSLISVSTDGVGDAGDVALRLLAFMLRHGLAVESDNQLSIVAADVLAHNLVGIAQAAAAPAHALHLTADRYYSMTELTRVLEREHGYRFRYLDIAHFIAALNETCTPEDPVFPLLDFFNRSADKIDAMQLKRYGSTLYRRARARLARPRADPSLSETAACLLRYLCERGWVGARPASNSR